MHSPVRETNSWLREHWQVRGMPSHRVILCVLKESCVVKW